MAIEKESASAIGGKGRAVCVYWRAGRCNRHPCPFLHGEVAAEQLFARQSLTWRRNDTEDTSVVGTSGGGGGGGGNRPCKYFLSGRCSYGDRCRYLHAWSTGDQFSLLTALEGGDHEAITAIQLPSGSDKLYSSSVDGTLRVWHCNSGECTTTANLGGQIGCIMSDGPLLFVGIRNSIMVLALLFATPSELIF